MLLRSIYSRLRAWLAPAPRKLQRSSSAYLGSMLEPLESRIAPATLISPHIVTYTDSDGDHVTIKSSAAIFVNASVANTILTFNTGTVLGTADSTHQQLEEINLSFPGVAKLVSNDNITVSVVKAGAGDGFANVGFINSNAPLGHVSVQGDLGRISAGVFSVTGNHSVGLAGLTVHTFGAQGISTQAAGGNLSSLVFGSIGSITVQSDWTGAQLLVSPNNAGVNPDNNIGKITIGGNLTGASDTLSGSISTMGNVSSIVIGGNLQGGSGTNSGSLQVGGKIGSLSVNNILGYTVANDTTGMGAGSGSVITGGNLITGGIGALTVKGSITGGDGQGSALVAEGPAGSDPEVTSASFGNVKIGGSITGGSGDFSGQLNANAFGSISIGTGIKGGSGNQSGSIRAINGITSLMIAQGGITGGTNINSGSVIAAIVPTDSAVVGKVVIHGDITGNSTAAASITGAGQFESISSTITSFTLDGSLIGSASNGSGSVTAKLSIGHISINALTPGSSDDGSLIGGTGTNSGDINALSIGTLSIAGKLQGGGTSSTTGTGSSMVTTITGDGSAEVLTTSTITSITIGKGIFGGIGNNSGSINTGAGVFGDNVGSINITTGGITGGAGVNSGELLVGGRIGSVKLNGAALTGGAGASSGIISSTDSLGSVSLGSLAVGTGAGSGQISTGANLTSLSFTGATSGPAVAGLVSVAGTAGTITVHGDVTGQFLIGSGVSTVSISGALRGGTANDSGSFFAGLDEVGVIRSVTVTGGVIGGTGDGSGELFSGGGITKAVVGDLVGAGGQFSGSLVSDGALGAISVTGTASGVSTHGVIGGAGMNSGQISSGASIKSVTVAGALQGGAGEGSGTIQSHSAFTPDGDTQGDIGSIFITKSITGGTAANTGLISSAGNINSVTVGGSVTGAAFSGTGGVVAGADLITSVGGNITTLKIAGALQGANVISGSLTGSGFIQAGHIGSATVGSIVAGFANQQGAVKGGGNATVIGDGAILAANDIASLTVTGSITGTYSNRATISAVGQLIPGKAGDIAIGKLAIGTDVTFANILAGYDQDGNAVNGAASIGAVSVGGNWAGSNLAAGVLAGSDGNFGTPGTLITSSGSVIPTIASIIIKGKVENPTLPAGVQDAPDTYGFVAKDIKLLSVAGALQTIKNGELKNVGTSTDTDAIEDANLA